MTGMHHPSGFVGIASRLGLKPTGTDFALICAGGPATSAAVFTRSRFAGVSVLLSREAQLSELRGVVVISKNANVATGEQGRANALEVRERAARLAGCRPEQLVIASTGVIGVQYPMEVVRAGMDALHGPLPEIDFEAAATAIMTTDTHPKIASAAIGEASLVGIAKGVGMIEPQMATMLAFFFTDARLPAEVLDAAFRRVVDRTFNALSIDTDTSTSDTAAIVADGLAGPVDPVAFEQALYSVALDLTRQIASDGEGATKRIEVEVSGARDTDQARRVAKSVVNSPLVKTAVYGADPNWGRVTMAIGKLQDDLDIVPEKISIRFGAQQVYPTPATPEGLARLTEYLRGEVCVIGIDLGIARGSFTAYGCDLTEGYVRINADYTT